MIDLQGKITQAQFGELVGISQPAVSELVSRGVLLAGDTAGRWLRSYCDNLREQAAGRMGSGESGLDLVEERAKLAGAQREKIEMQNAVTRRELAKVSVIESVLATIGRQIAGILDAVPPQLRRNSKLSADDIEFVARELAKARNLAASIQLDESAFQDSGDRAGDELTEGVVDGSV